MPSSCCEHGDMCLCVEADHTRWLRMDATKELREARAAYNAARSAFQANRTSLELKSKMKAAWTNLHAAMVWSGLFGQPDLFLPEADVPVYKF